jgi:hypothetical protein
MSERESRRTTATESPLSPISLIGSFVLYRGERVEMGQVVGEPQPGKYLVEFIDLMNEKPKGQRIVAIENLMKVDEEGGVWVFYDTAAELKAALWEVSVR